MIINLKKYRHSIYFLLVIYVNSFFFSPYIHHHHDAQSFDEVVILHSHIFDSHEEDHDHSEEENHLEKDSSHEHLAYNTAFKFIRIAKTLSNILSYETYSIVDYQSKTPTCESETRIVTDLPSKLHWERYIYTASNLSPPLV